MKIVGVIALMALAGCTTPIVSDTSSIDATTAGPPRPTGEPEA